MTPTQQTAVLELANHIRTTQEKIDHWIRIRDSLLSMAPGADRRTVIRFSRLDNMRESVEFNPFAPSSLVLCGMVEALRTKAIEYANSEIKALQQNLSSCSIPEQLKK